MEEKLINTDHLYALVDFEPFMILTALLALAWVFYKVFLREASADRHKIIKRHFHNIFRHYAIMLTLFVTFIIIVQSGNTQFALVRTLPYLGSFAVLWGMIVFVKTCRLIILQYLFLGSMKHGVPVLVVNIFSLLLSIALGLWFASHLFGIQIAPLLATSAAFSIILGLAMQDTLGNLFAGISLQIDKSFEIGDWLEIINASQKTVGQVKEITWRATVLIGWTEETITIPNRVMANSQIANYTMGEQPIVRSQVFRLHYDVDVNLAKQSLLESTKEVAVIRSWPEPSCFISETTDSWLTFKLIYFIDNYGAQYTIGDQVVVAGLKHLRAKGIATTLQKIEVLGSTGVMRRDLREDA